MLLLEWFPCRIARFVLEVGCSVNLAMDRGHAFVGRRLDSSFACNMDSCKKNTKITPHGNIHNY